MFLSVTICNHCYFFERHYLVDWTAEVQEIENAALESELPVCEGNVFVPHCVAIWRHKSFQDRLFYCLKILFGLD